MLKNLWMKMKFSLQKFAKQLKQLKNQQKLQQIISWIKILITGENPNNEDETPGERLKRGVIHKGALAAVSLLLAVAMIFAMTAAWYSNIVQTTGLIFNVSDWGLDGNVDIQNELTNAAPGESGRIPVVVNNTSEGIIDVTFNVSKVGLYNDIADMRKRLYFYIDDAVTRNGETANRVYINSVENYSYTVLAKQQLSLGENGNGAALVWEWVYDVLGYYFYGTVTKNSAAQITEYLRPIKYDFDSATFSNDLLATVDGTTSAMDFVSKTSQNDGYEGKVTSSIVNSEGKVFYPVSVDENGTGVWIYCCKLSEIEYENVVDTSLGNATDEATKQFKTTLNVLAEQKKLSVATIATSDDFKAALNDDTHNMLVLSEDVTLDESISLAAESEKIVDLSGNTITFNNAGNSIKATEGSAITLMNGKVKGKVDSKGYFVEAIGSDVALSGLTISDFYSGISICDEKSTGQDTRMNITDCDISCSDMAVFIKGNGSISEDKTYINIENSKLITTGYYAISGNGTFNTNGNWGTDITIKNCTVQGNYSAIYHPQRDSRMLIEDSTLLGITPLAIKGGDIVIKDSVITASNEDGVQQMITPPKFVNSGYSDTGAGIYVETGYNYPCSVAVSGKTEITSYYHDSILLFESTNPLYKITVSGGNYSHDVSNFLADGYICEKDGDRFKVSKK